MMQVVPDDILQQQVCQECFNYLSVNPIVINKRGESICGRCDNLKEDGQNTWSLFNIVARGFYFKCINHFNGCTKILAFEEVPFHEKECCYEPQECIFCPFSGNLSQIFNHAMRMHPENVSFSGIISLPLSNNSFEAPFLFRIKNNHLLFVKIELTETLFKVVLKLLTKKLPLSTNQYAIKLYKPGDQEFNDYGLFSINVESSIEKPKENLIKKFGRANIFCQIFMDTFTLEKKELELQRRIFDLQRSEEDVANILRKLQMERNELLQQRDELNQQRESYDFAKEVVKKMSYNFFKCCKCKIITFDETFFCPKSHCYCNSCVSSFCDVCGSVREFHILSGLEKFIVSCDWPGCDENIYIKNFWNHKIECNFRPYRCPLQNCNEIILSVKKFREHWHAKSPALIVANEVIFDKYGCEEYYLISKGDIYHLLIRFQESRLQAYAEEYNVLGETVKFKCSYKYNSIWRDLGMPVFYGRYHIDVNASASGYRYDSIKISVS